MGYTFDKVLHTEFDEAVDRVKKALKKEGFGVLTEIDVQEVLNRKLDVDFKKYKILGVCNPEFAYKALMEEDKIGTMLPCNVIVQEREGLGIEVSAVDPVESMRSVPSNALYTIAYQVRNTLKRMIEEL